MQVSELLLDTLQDLVNDDFKAFRWFLTHPIPGKYRAIPKCKLESLHREDTVDTMVDSYTEDGAMTVAVEILKKMNKNYAVENLQKTYAAQRGTAEGAAPSASEGATPSASSEGAAPSASSKGAAPSASSSALPAPASVTIIAKDGSVVTMPSFSGVTIGGSFDMSVRK